MNILILGPKRDNINTFFNKSGDNVVYFEEKLTLESRILNSVDFIISYGYRHIIKKEIVYKYHRQLINLHISFLPWNKGADPNLWSFLEDTPKGVTIHYIDEDLDTGDIIIQKKIPIYQNDTLHSTYERLTNTIEHLLMEYWDDIKSNNIQVTPQPQNTGSYHQIKDKQDFLTLLSDGWKTPIKNLIGRANQRKD